MNISEYTIVKKIGTKSKSADIYLCSSDGFMFVCKKYKDACSASTDIRISQLVSSFVLADLTPHFNTVYVCENDMQLCPLLTADLKSFLKSYIRYDVISNTLTQILICINTFHKYTGLTHADCYHGNFLYKRVSKGGYIHYRINGKDLYVENLGYVWIINDFDMANNHDDPYNDYKNALEAFVNYAKIKKTVRFGTLLRTMLSVINENNNVDELFSQLIEKNLLSCKYTCEGRVINPVCYELHL